MPSDLRGVFEALGFFAHPIACNHSIDPTVWKLLSTRYPASDVTRLIQALPDLFVLHAHMEQGIFFVREGAPSSVPSEVADSYRRFYPKDILLPTVTLQSGKKTIRASWFGERTRTSLVDAIRQRFKYQPVRSVIQELNRAGWVVE
jgi:hypothetical protein